ncbi:MAG TPA: ornithine--oxo-acid transaminase [Acidimicrobiales bacterium]|nr:ornithine--oxo-acid transaminase [Acidimicrobiales bacterium]
MLGTAERAADLERRWSASNYAPLPVTLVEAEGAWATDEAGVRYLDLLSAYSALNFGHRHPRLVAAAHAQLDRLTLTSRAFHNDQLGPFCAELAQLVGMDGVLPMNTGAEAVETAIKAARRWAEAQGRGATIVVADGNFHGRTTTIVGFSSDDETRRGFGPFTPGFVSVPFGDLGAVRDHLHAEPRTAAVLVEPVQGEAGVVVPPDGYLAGLRRLCDTHGALLVLDEVQSGLGRTGRTLACDHEGVRPDVVVLGKALGGGIVPLSVMAARRDVIDVFTPGSHGSTFGGNPLACAVGREVVAMLRSGEPQAQAAALGEVLRDELAALPPELVAEVRTRGAWAGVDLAPGMPPARAVCEALLARRVLVKDTHGHTLRIAPPFVATADELRWAVGELRAILEELRP